MAARLVLLRWVAAAPAAIAIQAILIKQQRPVSGPLFQKNRAVLRQRSHAALGPYPSSLTGTQLQNRLRSPYTLSTRPTGAQYLAPRRLATG